MRYTLANRCFKMCSNWTFFHNELQELRHIFRKNEYPESFIDSSLCAKVCAKQRFGVAKSTYCRKEKPHFSPPLFGNSFVINTNQLSWSPYLGIKNVFFIIIINIYLSTYYSVVLILIVNTVKFILWEEINENEILSFQIG